MKKIILEKLFIAGYVLLTGMAMADGSSRPVDDPPSQLRYTQLNNQGIVYFAEVFAGDDEFNWKLLVYTIEGEQILSIFDGDSGQMIHRYSHTDLSDGLEQIQLIELDQFTPLVASVWRRGVHGEQFVLSDPLKNRVLYHLTSSWPISFEACDQSIMITVTGNSDSEGIPIEETHAWYGPDNIKISQGESLRCPPDSIGD